MKYLIAFPLMIASICGTTIQVRADDAEEEVVAIVKKAGGYVDRNARDAKLPIVRVGLHGCKITDTDLKKLAVLSTVKVIDLSDATITDAGLEYLSGMKSLVDLNLQYTPVTDAGLKSLKQLGKLSSLDLTSTKVTDAGIGHLIECQELTELYLGKTGVTDAGVKKLVKLTKLEVLQLGNPKITDEAVKEIAAAQVTRLPEPAGYGRDRCRDEASRGTHQVKIIEAE